MTVNHLNIRVFNQASEWDNGKFGIFPAVIANLCEVDEKKYRQKKQEVVPTACSR